MDQRQKDELESIPFGHMLTVMKTLKEAGSVRSRQLLDEYEERIGMIAEGREVTPADVSAAWSSVLHLSDLMPDIKNRGDDDGQNAR